LQIELPNVLFGGLAGNGDCQPDEDETCGEPGGLIQHGSEKQARGMSRFDNRVDWHKEKS
jgi:hypothetical protein